MAKYSLYEAIKPKLGFKARKKIEDQIRYNELTKNNLTIKEFQND